jgi:ATP-dependent helicase HrpA
MTGDPIPAGSFRAEQLPPYLRATFAVHADDGEVVGQSKDIAALQHALSPLVRAAIVAALPPIEQSGKRRWTFGTIPDRIESGNARGYPALVDEGQTVGLRVLISPSEQRAAMWSGARRLVRIMTGTGRRAVARDLSTASALALARAPRWPAAAVLDRCIDAAADELLSRHGGPPWDERSFDELLAHVSPRLHATAVGVAAEAADIVALAGELSSRLAATTAPSLQPAVADMAAQLDALVPSDFPWAPGAARLPDVLRYLRGIERRLDKLPEDPGRDAASMRRVHSLVVEHEQLLENLTSPESRAEGRRLRWMLEEFRLSLFAQSLRPAYRVSEERVRHAFSELAAREARR